VTEVAARDRQAWKNASAEIGEGVAKLMADAPIGDVVKRLMGEQVELITSLPRDAAQRVHELAMEGLAHSTRASELSKRIMETGEVVKARANLIARTETGRAQTTFTRVRAEAVGSTQFQWMTATDSDVRPSHKRLNGKVFEWRDPPVCDDPDIRALPGCIWNCRCFALPLIPNG
jgi:SPP1 gp7 family putative phage head morphogenesis protein